MRKRDEKRAEKRELRASLSIYAALSMMLIASVIFVFLEGAREREMSSILQMNADATIESLFAGYQKSLWDTYHLLGVPLSSKGSELNLANQEGELLSYGQAMLQPTSSGKWLKGMYLYRGELSNIDMKAYCLMTDQDGRIYQKQVAQNMKALSGAGWVESLLSDLDLLCNLEKDEEEERGIYDAAVEALRKSREKQDKSENGKSKKSKTAGNETAKANGNLVKNSENKNKSSRNGRSKDRTGEQSQIKRSDVIKDTPLEQSDRIQKSGVLSLVVADTKALSAKSLEGQDLVSERNCFQGNWTEEFGSTGIADTVFYEKYLTDLFHSKIFGCFLSPAENKDLSYELEYLIGGKKRDTDNLKIVVEKLFLLREAANYGYLLTDAGKVSETLLMAEAIGGASLNPLLVEAIKQGLLFSWAATESILDIRALLQGKRIPLMKTADLWTSSLANLTTLLDGKMQAKESPAGRCYKEYLCGMLFLEDGARTSFRAMDLEELWIQKAAGDEEIRMDQMMVAACVQFTYDYPRPFSKLITFENPLGEKSESGKTASYSYGKAGE